MRMRHLLGQMLGWVVRLWVLTWRVRVIAPRELRVASSGRVVAFWHGLQMGLLALERSRPVTALVSHSPDGELQSGVMTALGLTVVRGSSSRGGARGYRALLAALANGHDVAMAVDGPRGPRGVVKPGALGAAIHARAPLIPAAAWSRHAIVLGRSWDHFRIPLPFARVVLCLGAPIAPTRARSEPALVARAIDRCVARAKRRFALASRSPRSAG